MRNNFEISDVLGSKFAKGLIGTGVSVVILLTGFALCTTKINPGHAGVVYNMSGGLEEGTLTQGLKPVAPWKNVRAYPISTETVWLTKGETEGSPNDDSFNTSTMEGKPVNVDAYFTYHVDVEKLPAVFNRFKGADIKTIESGYIRQQIKTASQAVTSGYSVLDLYGNKRPEIQTKILANVTKELTPFGIIVETFSFGEIRPDADTMKAIQAKVDAQQKLQQMQTELEQSKVTAEKARVDAKGVADAAVIKAQGEAKANELLQASLTDALVRYQSVLKWNGEYPQVVGGNQMIQLPITDGSK